MTSHTVSTAVIGAGDWGKNHVRKFHELGSLSAICEYRDDVIAEMQSNYNVSARDFSEIINDQSINALALVTPATTHKDLAVQALENGKHVFIEKPIALTTADAASIATAANDNKRILMVGHLLQYHPCFQKLKELVSDGSLGKIRHIHARRYNIGKFREQENVIWDLGPHDVSMVLSLVNDMPTEIRTSKSNYLLDDVSDCAAIQLRFPGNINAEISLSWLAPQKEHRLIVVGEKAMAVFDDTLEWDEKLRIHRHETGMQRGKPPVLNRDMQGEAIKVDFKEPLLNECNTFLNAITENKSPYTNGEEALKVIQILEAADAD